MEGYRIGEGPEVEELEEQNKETEVTNSVTDKRTLIEGKKVRWLALNDYPLCIFTSVDKGLNYMCKHCMNVIKRRQKTKLFLI